MPFLFLTADILDWNEEGACHNLPHIFFLAPIFFLFLTADILDWNEEGACHNLPQKYDTIIASDCVVSPPPFFAKRICSCTLTALAKHATANRYVLEALSY